MRNNPKHSLAIDIRNYDYLFYIDREASTELWNRCEEKNLKCLQFTHKFNSERTNSHFW